MNTIEVRDIELAVEQRGSGSPVLLVHGFPLDHSMWEAQIELLAPSFRVIAPDLCGFGASGTRVGTMTMEAFADDLDALLDALNVCEPITLCSLSMGGYIAFAYWRKYAARVGRFVLADTRATGDSPEAAGGRLVMAEKVLEEGHEPLVDAMLLKLFWSLTPEHHPETVERVRAMFLAASREGIAAALRGMACREDVTPHLPRINVPALVVVGEDDGVTTPREMHAVADAIPRSTYVEIRGAGHMTPMENPEAFNAALMEFLAETA